MGERQSFSTDGEFRYRSQLFTVRLWREPIDDHVEWRGKVQHVTSGEARYFRDWPGLIAGLQQILGNQLGHTK